MRSCGVQIRSKIVKNDFQVVKLAKEAHERPYCGVTAKEQTIWDADTLAGFSAQAGRACWKIHPLSDSYMLILNKGHEAKQ